MGNLFNDLNDMKKIEPIKEVIIKESEDSNRVEIGDDIKAELQKLREEFMKKIKAHDDKFERKSG
jgi:hypothetical protein